MVKVVVLGFPSKLLSKLSPDLIREALQPSQPKANYVPNRPQQEMYRCICSFTLLHVIHKYIDYYVVGIP